MTDDVDSAGHEATGPDGGRPPAGAQAPQPRVWPSDPAQLADTTLCPACFSPLTSTRCGRCGLDLASPRAVELLAVSTGMATAEQSRQSIISVMRGEQAEEETALLRRAEQARVHAQAEQAARNAAAQAAAHEAQLEQAALAEQASRQAAEAQARYERDYAAWAAQHPQAAQEHAARTRQGTPASAAAAGTGAPRRRRSSVQITLLIVGVSLVAVAAIFFLTVAWIVAGLAVRSIIVGGLTIAALLIAALLRRRALTATAEGIGALGVVLVLLDVWAIRSNNLFGAAAADALVYWGIGALIAAGIFLLWHVLSGLRVASVAGFVLAAPAAGVLVGGLTARFDVALSVFLAFITIAVVATLYRMTATGGRTGSSSRPRNLERVVQYVYVIGSIAAAGATTWFIDPTVAGAGGLGVVVLVSAGHVALLVGIRRSVVPASIIAALGVIAAALIAIQVSARLSDGTLAITVPTLGATFIALALEFVARRTPAGKGRVVALVAAVTAGGLAALALCASLAGAAVPLALDVLGGMTGGRAADVSAQAISFWALGAAAATGVLCAAAWLLGGALRQRRQVFLWFGAVLVALAVAFAAGVLAPLLGYLALAVVACIWRLRLGRAGGSVSRAPLTTLMVAATVAAYLIGWARSDTWWMGTLGAIGISLASRAFVGGRTAMIGRAVLFCVSLLLTVSLAGVASWTLTLGGHPSPAVVLVNVLGGIALATACSQVFVAIRWRRLALPIERATAFWVLLIPSLVFLVPTADLAVALNTLQRAQLLQPEPWASVVRCVILTIALVLWLLAGSSAALRVTRRAAAAMVGPVLGILAISLARALTPRAEAVPAIVAVAVIASAGVVAVGAGLTLAGRRADRVALEIGGGVVVVIAMIVAGISRPDAEWLVLLIAAVGLLLASIAVDGLFGSRSVRRHLGWVALAAGVAALWLRLAGGGVGALEPYVLPPAVALLILALLVGRFGGRHETGGAGSAALVFAGLALGVLPSALTSGHGTLVRPIVVAAVSAALAIVAATVRWRPRAAMYLAGGLTVGVLGLFIVGFGRVVSVVQSVSGADARVELWLIPIVVVAGVGALLLPRPADAAARRFRDVASRVMMCLTVVFIAVAELIALSQPELRSLRAVLTVAVLSTIWLIARWRREAPFGAVLSWISLGLAALSAAVAVTVAAVEPFELITAPLVVAVLAGCLIELRRGSGSGWSVLWLIALSLGLLPSALYRHPSALPDRGDFAFVGGPESQVRPITVFVVATAVLLATVLIPAALIPAALSGRRTQRRDNGHRMERIGSLIVAAAALVVTAGVQAATTLARSSTDVGPAFDLWLGAAALVLCVAGAAITLRAADRIDVSVGAVLVSAGIAVGLLPAGLLGSSGAVGRPIAVLTIAGVIAVVAALLCRTGRWRPVAWPALWVAVAAVACAAGGRLIALFTPAGGPADGRVEAWLLPALAVIVAVAFALPTAAAREPSDESPSAGFSHSPVALIAAALIVTLVVEAASILSASPAALRVIVVAWVFSALHAVTFLANRRPLTRLIGWLAIACAGIVAVSGWADLRPIPPELVSIPIAAALLVSGSLHLDRVPTARSWQWLAPGVAVLLMPSLIISFTDAPLWRIVGLGVVAIAVLVLGLVLRLQAPFLLGSVVVIIHAIAQLWPWISVAYQATPWWLWLGIGGVILILLAARYERRIRDVKSIVLRVSALR